MQKIFLLSIILLIHISGIPQSNFKTTKISNDLELIQISQNAYVHVSYSMITTYGRVASNGLIYVNDGQAFLFDTPMNDSLTKALYSWITDSLNLKITGFVPNHWHADCMGGLGFLQSMGIKSYANQMTIDIAKEKGLPLPTYGFKDSLILTIGGKLIKCYYFGAAHSSDNIVVWIPSESILFAGCMVKDLNAQSLGNIADANLKEWPKTIDKLIEKFKLAKIVIPGHGQFGGFELLEHTKELLKKNSK
jgi:metallo-beta-lactamase class B